MFEAFPVEILGDPKTNRALGESPGKASDRPGKSGNQKSAGPLAQGVSDPLFKLLTVILNFL